MSAYYFRTWHTLITAELAAREPIADRLFAEEDAACPNAAPAQRNAPERKEARFRPGDLRRYNEVSQITSDLAFYSRLKRH